MLLVNPFIEKAVQLFGTIPTERKETLLQISHFIEKKIKAGQNAELTYICTHNSRRSHFGQVWGQTAAYYYGIKNVFTYSGGTEATAFNPNAIKTLETAGFRIRKHTDGANPHYLVIYATNELDIICFSKVYNDAANPQKGFCAIMTCIEADGVCPIAKGAELRVTCPYGDPKAFDDTPIQNEKYLERCLQIATETLWAFSQVKK